MEIQRKPPWNDRSLILRHSLSRRQYPHKAQCGTKRWICLSCKADWPPHPTTDAPGPLLICWAWFRKSKEGEIGGGRRGRPGSEWLRAVSPGVKPGKKRRVIFQAFSVAGQHVEIACNQIAGGKYSSLGERVELAMAEGEIKRALNARQLQTCKEGSDHRQKPSASVVPCFQP